VNPVCQLDQNHADIARHGQQHFAKRLRLIFFTRVELEFFEFCKSIHQVGYRCAKALDEFGLANITILHGIVQQSCHQGRRIEFPFSALLGYSNGVGDIRLATVSQLAQVGLVGKTVGLTNIFNVCCTQIIEFGSQRGKAGRSRIGSGRCGCRLSGNDGCWHCVHTLNVMPPE